MSTSLHSVEHEVAYDLLQDHFELVLRLIDEPMSRQTVVELAGSAKAVDRLERYGLVHAVGPLMQTSSKTIQQVRQDGMVAFLERYVLPSLTADARDQTSATYRNLYLSLDDTAQQGLLPGPVQRFFEALSGHADARLAGSPRRLSVLVLAAPDVQNHEPLAFLRSAAKHRSASATRERAIVSQFDCFADPGRFRAIARAIDEFAESLQLDEARREQANYQIAIATHWRVESVSESLQ